MTDYAPLPDLRGVSWLAVGHQHPTWADFGATEWISIVLASAVVVWVLWKAVLYTLRPGETEPDHIKRMILQEPLEGVEVSIAPGAAVVGGGTLAGPAREVDER